MVLRQIVVDSNGVTLAVSNLRSRRSGLRWHEPDCDGVVGRGRTHGRSCGRMWMLNSPRTRGRQRTPDAKPIVIHVLGDEDAIVRTPIDDIPDHPGFRDDPNTIQGADQF